MIYGIGCDICEISRVKKALAGAHGEAFVRKVYGEREREALRTAELCAGEKPAEHGCASAAANFAAKEAFLKAAGTGLSAPFALNEIEALRLESGAPVYALGGKAAEWLEQKGLKAHLSLSHDGGMALAFCVLETK